MEDLKNKRTVLLCLVLLFILSLGLSTASAADSNDDSSIELDQDLGLSDSNANLDEDILSDSNYNFDKEFLSDSNTDLEENTLSNSNFNEDSYSLDSIDNNIVNNSKENLNSNVQDESNILADSNTIYVSPDGNDENDGLSRDTPLGNISTAVSHAGEGDTIYLLPGVYNQSKSTQLSKNLYFIGENGAVVNRTGTSNVFTYTSENIKTVSFKNIVFVSDTPNPSNPILSMVGHARLVVDNCTFTHVIAGRNGVVRVMGNATGNITNCRFVDLSGSTNGGSSYLNILGEAIVRVNNCTFSNISNGFLRSVVYVNNDLANLTMTNSHFYNISGNTNAIVENRGYMRITNSTFHDISLEGNSPVGIIWTSETISKNSISFINSSSFYNISIKSSYSGNSSIIQAKSPTVVEFSSFLNNDVDFIVNNDNDTNITANYNWWGTNQNPKDCSINVGGEIISALVSDGVDIDNWAIMTVDFDASGLIAGEEYPIIISINKYLNERGEVDSSIEYGINAEVLLDSIIGEFNSSSIVYNGSNPELNHAKVYTKNGIVAVVYKGLEEGSDLVKIMSGYEEITYNLELGRAISYIDIYVSKSGNDSNDGLTNGSAVLSISRALEVASQVNSNARIHISSGTYQESGLELNGTYTDDGTSYRTIYSFIGYGNVVIDGNGGNKSLFLIRNNSASFKNIRFTNVNNAARGGALSIRINDNGYIYEPTGKIIADLSINNCTFDNINANGYGGAILYEYGSGKISINNTKFYNLSSLSSQGGAIYIQESSELAKVKMTGCDFRDNFANNAGAMYLRASNITISNTNVINNSAAYYPGAIMFYNASAVIENCVISNNSAKRESSAIEIDQGSNDEGNVITVKSCIIENNTAIDEPSPAIYVVKGCLNISFSSIVNDFSLATGSYYSQYAGYQQGVAIANNNWWGVNNPFGIDDLSEYNIYHIINSSSIINGSNITIDRWVILNVNMNDSAVLKVGNIVNITVDFNHVNTTMGEIEELTGGKIPREYSLRVNATGGRVYPSYIRTVNGVASTRFTVVDEEGLGDNFTFCAVDISTDNEIYHIEFEINNYKGVIFMSVDGDDNRNGSRDSPVRTIERAIELAIDEEFGSHEIFVMPGTYEVCGIDIDYTYLSITGSGKGISIFDGVGYTGGMFSIFESNLTVRNLSVVGGVNTYSSGGAFTNMGNLTLDGVNVSNCQVKNVNGAVIYSVGNLNLINSSFVENTALSGNYASGGVIYADGYYTSLSYPPSLNITDCEFISNVAGSQSFGGGAIYMQYVDGFKSIVNTKFIGNKAMFGGAIFMQNSEGNFIMDNVSFIGNKATGSTVDNPYYGGGALCLIGKTDGRVGNISITNSIFENNSARYTRGGGAIMDRNVDLNISNSVILGNTDSSRNIQIYKDTTVYFPSGARVYLEDNWWGANDLSQLSTLASNASINRWAVMDLAVEIADNESSSEGINQYAIAISIDKYNDGSLIKDNLNYGKYSDYPFERRFKLTSSTGSFNPQSGILTNNSADSIFSSNTKENTISATIDAQTIAFNTMNLYVGTVIGLEVANKNISTKRTILNISLTDIDSNPLNGTVILSINGSEQSVNIEDGKASVEIELNDGLNNVTARFDGNGKYLESLNSCIIEVNPTVVNMTLSVEDVVVGEPSNARIFVYDQFGNPLDLTVNLNVNNNNYSVEIKGGEGSISIEAINAEGKYTATASIDNEDYEGIKTCEAILTVYGIGNVTVKHTDAGDAADIQAAIDAANPGDVVQLGNYRYADVADVNITKNITLAGCEGTGIESTGDGTPIFNIVSKDENGPENVNINGIDFKLKNRDTVAVAKAQNDTENPLAIDTQAISITDNSFETFDDDVVPESINILCLESERGVLSPSNEIRISGNTISAGINPFKFEVSSVVSGSDANVVPLNITAQREATKIIYSDMNTTAVSPLDPKTGEWFIWRLVDGEGNPIANTPMKIGFNGVIYDEKNGMVTDENGYAKLQINLGYKGDYTFAISFLGDDNYNASFAVAKIKVATQNGSLTVPNKSYTASAKTKSLTATFKTKSGKAVANKKIIFTVNGKTYSAKTNDKGVATVNVSLSKKGTYSFTAKYAGDSTYSEMSKTAKLVIK